MKITFEKLQVFKEYKYNKYLSNKDVEYLNSINKIIIRLNAYESKKLNLKFTNYITKVEKYNFKFYYINFKRDVSIAYICIDAKYLKRFYSYYKNLHEFNNFKSQPSLNFLQRDEKEFIKNLHKKYEFIENKGFSSEDIGNEYSFKELIEYFENTECEHAQECAKAFGIFTEEESLKRKEREDYYK